MELTIAERFMAQSVMPAQGNFVTLRVIMEAQMAIGFTSDEIEKYGIVSAEGLTTWSKEHAKTTSDIHISNAAMDILREELDKLNGDSQLTAQHMSLFEKVHAATTQTE